MPSAFRKIPLAVAGLLVALVLAEVLLRVVGFGVVTPEMSFGMNTRSALELIRTNRETFPDWEDALNFKYDPCRVCKPMDSR